MGEGKQAWGWYPAGNIWVPLQVAATGKLVIDPTAVFEEPPTLGELEKGATSNWCNLHAADADAHHDAFTPADHQADPHTMTLDGVDLSAHAANADAHHDAFVAADHTAIGDAAPHHARYTDAEVLALASDLAHHARHEAGGADALANPIAIAALPNLTSTKIWQGNVSDRPVEVDLPAGGGLTYVELIGNQNKAATGADAWEDWDLSGIVPADTQFVEVWIYKISALSRYVGVRINGSAIERKWNMSGAAGKGMTTTVGVDANRKCEIFATSETTNYTFNIKGYWI